jgi:hypothetical protein
VAAAEPLAIGAGPHAAAHLGGQHEVVAIAALLHPLADDGLSLATLQPFGPARVDVGGIDEIAAGRRKGI